jgi:hypothetical protein
MQESEQREARPVKEAPYCQATRRLKMLFWDQMLRTRRKDEATEPFAIQPVVLAAALLVISWLLASPSVLLSERASHVPKTSALAVLVEGIDPNKPASELNHHLAGYALIAIALLMVLGESSERLRFCRRVWPLLFVATGLFLAAWSDREIWPRGDLSWTWLIHHDFEARQHKIYAIVLVLIGLIEHARAGNHLPRPWRTWAFPLLALFGACLLLFHDHTQASGASSPEAQAYRVSWSGGSTLAANQDPMASPAVSEPFHHRVTDAGDASVMRHTTGNSDGHDGMQMSEQNGSHYHHMTASEMKVESEHFWFFVAGLGIASLKLLSDGGFWRRWFVPVLWPSLMGVLGVLLIVYTE